MFDIGQQIVSAPSHILINDGKDFDITSDDLEYGFVTEDKNNGFVFCRYWFKNKIGNLRTKANSELTPKANLWPCEHIDQVVIDNLLVELGYKEEHDV